MIFKDRCLFVNGIVGYLYIDNDGFVFIDWYGFCNGVLIGYCVRIGYDVVIGYILGVGYGMEFV